ncbi:MAG: 3'-5' exonuclease [Bacteroidota bacterium]
MQFIILDLEATCWADRSLPHSSEIIEIGAVKLDHQGHETDQFMAFVKPVLHPTLSDFCTQLTTIRQEQVDAAAPFPSVIKDFMDWIGVGTKSYVLGSWGHYDRKQLEKDCKLHEISCEWLQSHFSVKHQFAKLKQFKRPCGLGQALDNEGLTFKGTPHRGIDDARNIVRIFSRYFDQWKLPV